MNPAPCKNSNFCPLPWTHLASEANGNVRPCCIHQQKIPQGENDFIKIDENSIPELLQTDYMKDLRQQFRENKRPEACHMCWDDEDNGKESKRQMSIRFMNLTEQDLLNMVGTEPKNATYLQLILTNQCNLKCRSCNPVASSKWILEGRDRGLYKYRFQDNREIFRPESVLYQTKSEWLPHLRYLEIMGGEPFLQKDVEDFLREIASSPYGSKMHIFISSNATMIPEKMFMDLRGKLRFLGVNLSIDGIGERYEYLRHGGKWDVVQRNIAKYDLLNALQPPLLSDMDFMASVQVTVSMMNVFYMPETLRYFAENFPRLRVAFNMVFYPIEYDCVHVPKTVKTSIREEFEKHHSDERIWPTLQRVLNHLESREPDHFTFQAGLVALMDGDQYRKESFPLVFPEFYALIQDEWQTVQRDYSYIKMIAQKKQYLMIDNSMQKRQDEVFKKQIAF